MKVSENFLHKSEIMFGAWERGKLLSVKFCRFGDLARTRVRALQRFCTFCFHNLHRKRCNLLSTSE